jgi:hypothetical protein
VLPVRSVAFDAEAPIRIVAGTSHASIALMDAATYRPARSCGAPPG